MEPPVSAVPKVIMTLPRAGLSPSLEASPSEAGCFSPQATRAKTIASARIRDNTFFMLISSFQKFIYPACAEYDKKVKFSVPARNREKTTWSFSRTPHPRAVCLVRSQLIHFLWTDYNSFILVLSSLSQAYFPVFSMKFSGHCHSAQKCFFLFVLLDTFFFCFFSKIQISP